MWAYDVSTDLELTSTRKFPMTSDIPDSSTGRGPGPSPMTMLRHRMSCWADGLRLASSARVRTDSAQPDHNRNSC